MPYGTAAIDAISSSGNLAITGNVTTTGTFALGSQALGTATAGEFEYDGRVPYFTPLSTQRGVVPGMQYYRLESNLAGANINTAQSMFGVGVTLSASTVYAFESFVYLQKTAGATSHGISFLFGGTATVNNIYYTINNNYLASANPVGTTSGATSVYSNTTSATGVQLSNITSANYYWYGLMKGTVSINAGGTFIPQYILSAAPGGAYSTMAGSYFNIYPIGAAGSNINVGTWA